MLQTLSRRQSGTTYPSDFFYGHDVLTLVQDRHRYEIVIRYRGEIDTKFSAQWDIPLTNYLETTTKVESTTSFINSIPEMSSTIVKNTIDYPSLSPFTSSSTYTFKVKVSLPSSEFIVISHHLVHNAHHIVFHIHHFISY